MGEGYMRDIRSPTPNHPPIYATRRISVDSFLFACSGLRSILKLFDRVMNAILMEMQVPNDLQFHYEIGSKAWIYFTSVPYSGPKYLSLVLRKDNKKTL